MQRLTALIEMLAAEPTNAFLLFALAKEYESNADDATALTYYLQCGEYNPDYVGLYYHLGKLYERAQDFDAAITAYTKGIAVAKAANDRHAQNELSMALMEIEE